MIQSIIIEDEKPAARRLERLLIKNGLQVLVMLHSVKDAIYWLQHNPNPDLLFLDIQLSDGLSFEIFDEVAVSSAIIFTTAYDQYAIKAFKHNSVDYLLKPIEEEELSVSLQKFRNLKTPNAVSSIDLNLIKELLGETEVSYKNRFTTQIGQHLKLIEIEIIECFYSQDKSTYIYTNTGKSYPIDGGLEYIYDALDPKLFFRVNRKFIVKLSAINDMISYANSRLQIKLNNYNQDDIIVSREKVKEFKKWLS